MNRKLGIGFLLFLVIMCIASVSAMGMGWSMNPGNPASPSATVMRMAAYNAALSSGSTAYDENESVNASMTTAQEDVVPISDTDRSEMIANGWIVIFALVCLLALVVAVFLSSMVQQKG